MIIMITTSLKLSDPLEFAVIDIGFAISATSIDAATTFKLMKEAIKSITSKYFTHNLRYGIIVFGSQPNTVLEFGEVLLTVDILKMKIDAIRRLSGSPDMISTLKAGKEMFGRRGSRPHSRKFLVVILDNRVRQLMSLMGPEAKQLEDAGIRVIAIAVGDYTYPQQLHSITPLNDNIMEVPKTEDPTLLGQKIVKKIKKSKSIWHIVLLVVAAILVIVLAN